jgi:alanine-synthesizing transaminase
MIEAVERALRDKFTGYTPSGGLPDAREAVASWASSLGAPTEANHVLITAGASEAAELLLTALVDEGDEVLVPAPGYPLYTAILGKLGAVARYYKLQAEGGWQPDINEVAEQVTSRTRAILLINPNNPTGSITSDSSTHELIQLAGQRGLLVIADEVYRELSFTRSPTPSSVFAESLGVPLITLESLSKTHLVPGWRIGWMRFTNPSMMEELIASVNRLADARLCAPAPPQYAVRPALEGDKTFQEKFIAIIEQRRNLALQLLEGIPGLSCQAPNAGFFMLIRVDDVGSQSDERFVLDLLEETGVLVVHGSGFGIDPNLGYFRLVYLAEEAILKTSFNEIDHFLRRRAGQT